MEIRAGNTSSHIYSRSRGQREDSARLLIETLSLWPTVKPDSARQKGFGSVTGAGEVRVTGTETPLTQED